MIVLGFDPGLDGAIAIYWPDTNKLVVHDTPTMGDKKRRCINAAQLSHLIQQEIKEDMPWVAAFVEDVHAMIGWGIGSAFRFGESKGVLFGVLGALNIPTRRVAPQTWKKKLGLSRDKDASRKLAIETWPHHADLFARVKDDNRAEAALIAKYGWSQLQ